MALLSHLYTNILLGTIEAYFSHKQKSTSCLFHDIVVIMNENIHSNLNLEQKKAVMTLQGPLLILAGAGAGKTKTITHRILNLIKSGVAPRNILAITFTNKAAKEMRDRVMNLITNDKSLNIPISFNEKPFVSTFHSLGVHILKENCQILGLPRHFTIFDRSDSKRAVKEALEACNINPKEFDPGSILNAISREKGESVTLEQYRESKKEYFQSIVCQVWEKYENILNKEKALDFDDLLLKTAKLLKNNKEIRHKYNSIWKYIHIDEYQDTNRVQYEIATLLAEENRNICVVGDADQTIYTWRGANIENILNFEKEYTEAVVVVLEENYRSTQNILAAANNVIKKNILRKDKNLFTRNGEGEKLELNISTSEHDEASMIAEKCRDLIKNKIDPKEIAVLYRTNFQSRVIEEAFLKKNVAYQVLGVKFFDRKEVKDVISFIRASLNRDSSGDLVRIINVPPRGIGKTSILKIISNQDENLNSGIKLKISHFFAMLERINSFAKSNTPSETIKYILKETGMEKMYKDGSSEDQEKLENMRELVSVAAQYDHLGNEQGMEAFLENAALASDQDELSEERDAVKLMTVHAAKGLEFDYVFIAGLENNLFPHMRINEDEISRSEEEEERRLFYVAITRARKKVYLSYACIRSIYGREQVNTPSEFITDIGDELINEVDYERPTGVKAIFIDF